MRYVYVDFAGTWDQALSAAAQQPLLNASGHRTPNGDFRLGARCSAPAEETAVRAALLSYGDWAEDDINVAPPRRTSTNRQ